MQPIPGWAPFGATHTPGAPATPQTKALQRECTYRQEGPCKKGPCRLQQRVQLNKRSLFSRSIRFARALSSPVRSKPLRSPASTIEQRIPTHSQRPASPRPTQAHRTTQKENAAEERLDGVDTREEGHVLAAANGLVYTRAKESDKKMIDGGPQQPRENDWTFERFA